MCQAKPITTTIIIIRLKRWKETKIKTAVSFRCGVSRTNEVEVKAKSCEGKEELMKKTSDF